MDANKKAIIEKRIMKTGENLRKNNMEFYYAPTAADVKELLRQVAEKVYENTGVRLVPEVRLW